MMRALYLARENHVRKWIAACVGVALLLSGEAVRAQQGARGATTASAAARQTETDEYTRDEVLAPDSASFRIRYEGTATTVGAKYYYNPIRNATLATLQ